MIKLILISLLGVFTSMVILFFVTFPYEVFKEEKEE